MDDLDRLRDYAVLDGERLASLWDELARLRRENDFLRARAGNDDKECVYCGLGAAEQGKCASGFPGCDRADDQMLCREAGVAYERDELRRELDALMEAGLLHDRREDALRRELAEAREWIAATLHHYSCPRSPAQVGNTLVDCKCGRDALLKKLEVPRG